MNGETNTTNQQRFLTKEELDNYLNQPDVVKNLNEWANFFNKRFRGNWFTLEQVTKKSGIKNRQEAWQTMNLLILKSLAYQKEEEVGKGIIVKYKIVFTDNERLELLKGHLAAIDLQREKVQNEIKDLDRRIARFKK